MSRPRGTTSRWLLGVALIGVPLLLQSERARAEVGEDGGPRLSWTGAAGCPRPADLLGRVAKQIGVTEAGLRGRLVALRATVAREGRGGYRMRLSLRTASGGGERAFAAETCGQLVDGAVLIAALAIDPDAVARVRRRATPTVRPKRPATRRPRLALRPLAHVDLGVLPDPGLGLGLAGALLWPALRIELEVTHGLSVRRLTGGASSPGGDLRLPLCGALRGCWRRRLGRAGLLGRLELDLCLGAAFGWLQGEGVNITEPATGGALWWGALAGGAISLGITDYLWARLEARGGLSVSRARFEIEGVGLVHRAALGVGQLGGGVEVRLF